MLKLIYDVKCGFKDLYITANNIEEDLSDWINILNVNSLPGEPKFTEEDIYEQYKDDVDALVDEVFGGITEFIYEGIMLDYSKTFFKHICYADPKNPFIPNVFELTNLRLVLEDKPLKRAVADRDAPLKASEVMALLGISRVTLCHYVKKGLIKIDTNYTGKQYRYNKESVLELLKRR